MVILILIILGLAFGSFVNALVWRVHQQSLPKKRRAAADADLSISKGRSMCPNCKHLLAWYDLLPVLSWLSLGGRCCYCHKPISWQYPLVELATAALFVISYIFWPFQLSTINYQLSFVLWLASLVCLIALFVYDIEWMLLPNRIVFPLTVIATVYSVVNITSSANILNSLLEVCGAVLIAGGIFYLLFQLSSGRWIGGGDVKLGFSLGLLLTTPGLAFVMLFLSSVLGILAALPALITGKSTMQSKLPYGPFLIAATVITVLWGQVLIDWYANTFLYL